MTFNLKSQYALAVAQDVLAKPVGFRHGVTGFWLASLHRAQNQRLVRMAYMSERRFVFEAEIDAAATHVMTIARIDEYLEHELLKQSQTQQIQSLDAIRADLEHCIEQGRIVVAFRNARLLDDEANHSGRNPVWYTTDD